MYHSGGAEWILSELDDRFPHASFPTVKLTTAQAAVLLKQKKLMKSNNFGEELFYCKLNKNLIKM